MKEYGIFRKFIKKSDYKILLLECMLLSGGGAALAQNIASQANDQKENSETESMINKTPEKHKQLKREKEVTKVVKARDRGRDKLNFYIPIKEQNKFNTYGDVDLRNDKNIYKYTIGEGYVGINTQWDFNYRILREFYRYKTDKIGSVDSNSWDNEISFSRKNQNVKIGNKDWYSYLSFGVKHNENNTRVTSNTRDYKFYAGQKFSAFFQNIGMGGTYAEYGLTVNGINGSIRNGYSVLTSASSNSVLGYGAQWSNSLEGEYMDYNNYDGALRAKYETVLRWTYEIGKYLAFSPEATLKAEKYFNYNVDNLTIESSIGSYLLYSKDITDRFRVYGKVGPALRFDKTKYGDSNYQKSQLTGQAKFGIEYVY